MPAPSLPVREVRTRFTVQPRSGRPTVGPSMTDQSFTDECNINNVILRFAGTGELPPRINARTAEFLDVSDVPELREALEMAKNGNEFFQSLPDQVKQAVGYDPVRLLDALDEHQRLRASSTPDVSTPTPATPPVSPAL